MEPTTDTINRPIRNPDLDSYAANVATHRFGYTGGPDDGDVRCDDCDCRPSHAAAGYPCGADVPREVITVAR